MSGCCACLNRTQWDGIIKSNPKRSKKHFLRVCLCVCTCADWHNKADPLWLHYDLVENEFCLTRPPHHHRHHQHRPTLHTASPTYTHLLPFHYFQWKCGEKKMHFKIHANSYPSINLLVPKLPSKGQRLWSMQFPINKWRIETESFKLN